MRATGQKRNAYIHDPWAVGSKEDKDVAQLRMGGRDIHGQVKPVKSTHLGQLVAQLSQWSGALYDFHKRVSPLLPALHEKLDRTRTVASMAERAAETG